METINSTIQEIILLKFLLDKENFVKYFPYVKELNLEQESSTILNSIKQYFDEYPDKTHIDVQELITFNYLKNPLTKKKGVYEELFKKLEETNFNSALVEENFNNILEKYFGSEILFKISEALNDESSNFLPDVEKLIEEFKEAKLELDNSDKYFVESNLKDIFAKRKEFPGIKWRINSLNEHLGEIRPKTLGHVFARVDTGKTSFIISEESYWVQQIPDGEYIIHMNNEEDGEKLKLRFYQSLLNCDEETLIKYPEQCEKEFERLGGKKLKLYDNAIISIEKIEKILKKYKCRILVIDQADKIHFIGMNKLGDVARLQMVYAKLRELSKKYDCHILTVGQASVTAENKKWLMISDMDSSKTLKPGEFDYVIGIGALMGDASNLPTEVRYLHLAKNKLGTGQHAQMEVLFDKPRALYREPTYEELEEAYGNFSTKRCAPSELPYLDN